MESNISYASCFRRFGAYLLDHVATTILMLPLLIWYGRGLFSEQSGIYLLGYGIHLILGVCSIRALYLIIGWSTKGGTIGCRLLQIQILSNNGARVTPGRSATRYLALLVSTALFGLGWITIPLTRRRQSVHDFLAATIVVTTSIT